MIAPSLLLLAVLLTMSVTASGAADPPMVRGRVTDSETGAPVRGAEVTLFVLKRPWPSPRFERLNLQAGDEGLFDTRLPAAMAAGGAVYAFVRAPGYAEWRNLKPTGETTSSQWIVTPGQDLELAPALVRGRTLKGLVTDDAGRLLAGARLRLTLSGPGWCSWPQSLGLGTLHWPDDTRTDSDGCWEMLSFPYEQAAARGGRWVLTVEHDRLAPAVVQSLESLPVRDGVVTIRTTLLRGRTLTGRVMDVDRRPIDGAEVWLDGVAKPDEPMCVRVRAEGRSVADGSFTIGGLDDRTYEFHVKAKGYASPEAKELRVGDPQRNPFVVTLVKGETLRGRLLDDAGKPLDGIEIHLVSRELRLRETTETSSDGTFEFDGLPRGTLTLSSFTLFEQRVTVPSESVEIRLARRREVVIALRSAEEGKPVSPPAKVYFRGPNLSSLRKVEDADGKVSLGPLVPSEIEVTADAVGRAVTTKTVEVPPGDGPFEVAVELPRGFSLRGRVTDGGGHPIAGANVRAENGVHDIREATSKADGRYLLEGLNDKEKLVGGLYVLSASVEGYATEVALDAFSQSTSLERTRDFVLGKGGTVRGIVRREGGKPAAGVLVKALAGGRSYDVPTLPAPWTVTDEDGRFELRHVAPGPRRLVVGDTEQRVKVIEGRTVNRDFTVRE